MAFVYRASMFEKEGERVIIIACLPVHLEMLEEKGYKLLHQRIVLGTTVDTKILTVNEHDEIVEFKPELTDVSTKEHPTIGFSADEIEPYSKRQMFFIKTVICIGVTASVILLYEILT